MELTHTETIIFLLSMGGIVGFMVGVLVMDKLLERLESKEG